MKEQELEQLLREARQEILSLRQANSILGAKVEVMDLFACVLHTTPAYKPQCASPDVAYKLSGAADQLAKEHEENLIKEFNKVECKTPDLEDTLEKLKRK